MVSTTQTLALARYPDKRSGYSNKPNIYLFVVFSVPKLLFGNNFTEVQNEDLEKAVPILQKTLGEMGVEISEEQIRNAKVNRIHYSKNIIFQNRDPISAILDNLEKVNISSVLDTARTVYKNQGSSVQYHANSYEISFYDKLKDLEASKRSEKRAMEDSNLIQTKLLEPLKAKKITAFRIEVRLNNKEVLKRCLEDIGYPIEEELGNTYWNNIYESKFNLNFKSLFNSDISQKLCLHSWDLIEDKVRHVIFKPDSFYLIFNQLKATEFFYKRCFKIYRIYVNNYRKRAICIKKFSYK